MREASWAVVMTADEPLELLLANTAWHLATGALEVHVCLDRPDDPAAEALAAIAGVVVTRCDTDHWAELAPNWGRPPLQMRRQALNANHARLHTRADWIIHLDADEFLRQDAALGRELACFTGMDHEIRFPVWERAYLDAAPTGIFDGVFRTTTKPLRPMAAAILGDDERYMIDGMMGHSEGKCAVPTEGNWRIGIHWSFRGKGPQTKSNRVPSPGVRLLHFDGLTPLHFLIKLVRYAGHEAEDLVRLVSENRRVQIAELALGPRALHDRLRVLDGEKCDWLAGFGLMDRRGFDPRPEMERVLGRVPELSVDAFDAALRARYPEEVAALEALGL